VRALARGQVTVQLSHILENRNAGKGFYNIKDLLDLGLHIHERGLAAAFFELLARGREYPESSAADELQLSQVKNEVFCALGHYRGELAFQVRRSGGIQAAGELQRDSPRLDDGNIFHDLDFKWHITLRFLVCSILVLLCRFVEQIDYGCVS
jgi:hypothetical protein